MSQLDTLREQSARLDYLPDGMNWRKVWDPLVQYVKNDVVRSPLNTAAYVANYNSLGGSDPSQSPAGQPWTKLGKGEAESLIAQSVLDGAGTTDAVTQYSLVQYQNGVVFNKYLAAPALPLLFTLPTNVRNGSNTILMIVSGIILDSYNFIDGDVVAVAGPYQVGGSVAAPTTYPDGYIPSGTFTAGAITQPIKECLPTQVKFFAAKSGYYYSRTYNYNIPGLLPSGPPVPPLFIDTTFTPIYYGACSTQTMTFILQKGVDYTDATTQIGLGYASVQNEAYFRSIKGCGITADFVGL